MNAPVQHRRPRRKRAMALTADLVAQVTRPLEDPGLDPHLVPRTDEDYAAMVAEMLADHPVGADMHVFACGSLIWKPACPVYDPRVGKLHGWHRAFRMRITRWRATKEQPGLMMGLDRGGQCIGILYRVPAADVPKSLEALLRRELTLKPSNNAARWLSVDTAEGPVRALTFVLDRRGSGYVGRQSLADEVEMLAQACGHGGSCAEYLHNTVQHLSEFGIHDRNLWRLQKLVAERIARGLG